MPQLIRALLILLSAAVVLTLIFVAWWLAVAFVLTMLVVAQFRRLFGDARSRSGAQAEPEDGRPAPRAPLTIEGSFVREEPDGVGASHPHDGKQDPPSGA